MSNETVGLKVDAETGDAFKKYAKDSPNLVVYNTELYLVLKGPMFLIVEAINEVIFPEDEDHFNATEYAKENIRNE